MKLFIIFICIFSQALFAQNKTTTSSSFSEKAREKAPVFVDVLNKHSMGIGLGQTFFFGRMSNSAKDSISIPDLYYAYSASYSFDLLLNYHMFWHKREDRKLSAFATTIAIKGKIFQFDSFSPYILGGLGFYMPKEKRPVDGVLKSSSNRVVLGPNLGTGIDLRLNRDITIGVLLHAHFPFRAEQNKGPSVKGQYLKLLLTGMYTF